MATCYLSRLIPPLFPFHENVIALIRVTCWSKVISACNCRLLSEVLQAHVDAIVSYCSLLMIVFHLPCCIGSDLYICYLGNLMLFVILLDVACSNSRICLTSRKSSYVSIASRIFIYPHIVFDS